ncbi:MAG TPA: hypothetical protein VF796_09220, partial [Humisphaera sp.]
AAELTKKFGVDDATPKPKAKPTTGPGTKPAEGDEAPAAVTPRAGGPDTRPSSRPAAAPAANDAEARAAQVKAMYGQVYDTIRQNPKAALDALDRIEREVPPELWDGNHNVLYNRALSALGRPARPDPRGGG